MLNAGCDGARRGRLVRAHCTDGRDLWQLDLAAVDDRAGHGAAKRRYVSVFMFSYFSSPLFSMGRENI